LIGADGETPKKRRIAPEVVETVPGPTGPSHSGTHPFSLESLAADLKELRRSTNKIEIALDGLISAIYNLDDPETAKRFTALEKRLTQQQPTL
jgi:hypothetical protein